MYENGKRYSIEESWETRKLLQVMFKSINTSINTDSLTPPLSTIRTRLKRKNVIKIWAGLAAEVAGKLYVFTANHFLACTTCFLHGINSIGFSVPIFIYINRFRYLGFRLSVSCQVDCINWFLNALFFNY